MSYDTNNLTEEKHAESSALTRHGFCLSKIGKHFNNDSVYQGWETYTHSVMSTLYR